MSLQQPALDLGPGGTARRGLVVRHLILPGAVEDTLELLDWIGQNLSPFIGLSLMSQYHPCFKAPAEIQRSVSPEEYRRAAEKAVALGLDHLFLQPEPFGADEHLVPDFKKDKPVPLEMSGRPSGGRSRRSAAPAASTARCRGRPPGP